MTDLLFRGRRLLLESPLPVDEATRRLRDAIARPQWLLRDERTEPFEGTFENGRFRVVRLVKGRNSFRPQIDGVVTGHAGGTRVELEMRLSPVVVALGLALLAAALLVAVVAVAEALRIRTLTPQLIVVPIVAAGLLIAAAATTGETRRAVRLLCERLDARAAAPDSGR